MLPIGRIAKAANAAVWILTLLANLPATAARPQDEGTHAAAAQESRELHPLAQQQAMVKERLERLVDRMFRLSQELAESEPDNAARLARALQRVGEAGLSERMDEIIGLLRGDATLGRAQDSQAQAVADLEAVLAVLLRRDADNEERRNEIERLEQLRREVDRILERERELRRDSAQATQAQRLGEQLDAAVERVKALIQRQQDVTRQAGEAGAQESRGNKGAEASQDPEAAAAPRPLDAAARAQAEAAQEAAGLAEDVARLAQQAAEAAGQGARPSAEQSREGQPPRPSAGEPGARPPGDDPARPQPDAPGASSESKPGAGAQSASRSLKNAAREMSQAAEKLGDGEHAPAEVNQKEAAEQLRRALHALEMEREALNEQPAAGGGTDGDAQRQNADAARSLSEQMDRGSPPGSQPQEGQQGQQGGQGQQGEQGRQGQPGQQGQQQSRQGQQNQRGPQTPGREDVDRAEREMRDAADRLDEHSPKDAAESQDRAIDALEQAKQQLEDELNQKRKEQREEILRDIEARFRDMLLRQKAINEATIGLDAIGEKRFTRVEELRAADLARQEDSLAEAAGTCVHILDEEGTTVVFPRIIGQLRDDMQAVSQRLAAARVGALTQAMEAQIADTLEQLLEAVKRMQQENEQQQQQQQGQPPDGNAPLLPPSAELKLLRASQLRVNERTAAIEAARRSGEESGDALQAALQSAAQRQAQCAEIADKMREQDQGE